MQSANLFQGKAPTKALKKLKHRDEKRPRSGEQPVHYMPITRHVFSKPALYRTPAVAADDMDQWVSIPEILSEIDRSAAGPFVIAVAVLIPRGIENLISMVVVPPPLVRVA